MPFEVKMHGRFIRVGLVAAADGPIVINNPAGNRT